MDDLPIIVIGASKYRREQQIILTIAKNPNFLETDFLQIETTEEAENIRGKFFIDALSGLANTTQEDDLRRQLRVILHKNNNECIEPYHLYKMSRTNHMAFRRLKYDFDNFCRLVRGSIKWKK